MKPSDGRPGLEPGVGEFDAPGVGELNIPLLLVYGSGFYTALLVALHPLSVLKTRMQFATTPITYSDAVAQVRAAAGWRGFFAGLTPSLIGALPARSVYIAALESVRPRARAASEAAGADAVTSASVSNAAAGFAAVLAAQLTYCPTDVVTQRLMVADPAKGETAASVVRSILASGWTGLYRGLGVSLVAHLPAGSYSLTQLNSTHSLTHSLSTPAGRVSLVGRIWRRARSCCAAARGDTPAQSR